MSDHPMSAAIQAVVSLASEARGDAGKLTELFAIAADRSRDSVVRQAALRSLQELSFTSMLLRQMNAQLIAALRSIVDDPDEELREIAIEMLAQKKDEFVQRRLLDGLERREPPLVDDGKAIQFLGYDIHGGWFPTMRRLARESPDPATRLEAVKLLAADPGSADLLLAIFDDKGEDDDVRRASGSALMSVARDRFEPRAKEAVLDDSDTEPVRAASLTALTHFATSGDLANDADFVARLSDVAARSPSPDVLSDIQLEGLTMEAPEGDLAKAVRIFKERNGLV